MLSESIKKGHFLLFEDHNCNFEKNGINKNYLFFLENEF